MDSLQHIWQSVHCLALRQVEGYQVMNLSLRQMLHLKSCFSCPPNPPPPPTPPFLFFLNQSLAGKNSWELASLDLVVNSPRFPVFDLVKGRQYCFRVRSINKYGVSDPSEPSAPISLGRPQGEREITTPSNGSSH